MKHECFECTKPATQQLITQFAGTHLYCQKHAEANSDYDDMVPFPGKRPKAPPQPPTKQLLRAVEVHSDKGYSIGTKEGYDEFAKQRAQSLAKTLGLEPVPTHEELLQEVWYLRRRVRELEKQNLNYSWQLNPESMGR